MKIERLSKLLNSFGSSSQSTAAQSTNQANQTADEAVKIASGFGKAESTEDGSSARARPFVTIRGAKSRGSVFLAMVEATARF